MIKLEFVPPNPKEFDIIVFNSFLIGFTIISIFAGRMGDVGKDPFPIIKESVRVTRKLKKGMLGPHLDCDQQYRM